MIFFTLLGKDARIYDKGDSKKYFHSNVVCNESKNCQVQYKQTIKDLTSSEKAFIEVEAIINKIHDLNERILDFCSFGWKKKVNLIIKYCIIRSEERQ